MIHSWNQLKTYLPVNKVKLFKNINLKRILLTTMWLLIGAGSLALLVAAVHVKSNKHCKGLEVRIHGVSNNFFIDKNDIKKIITANAGEDITSQPVNSFNLRAMENELKKDVWIRDADLFFDNNSVLQASIEEREPIARVFTKGITSFYIDNTCMMLPISDRLSARIPVFTNFPSENKVLSKPDSSLLFDIRTMSQLIQKDSFLMAMIDQVYITPEYTFEMTPKIGEQIIVFGDASNAESKFNKLKLFYKKIMAVYGWGKYSVINLQYKGQVIGKLKGKDDVAADSLRTVEIMHEMAIESARQASDSIQSFIQDNERNTTSVSLIEQSMERDEEAVDEPMNQLQRMAVKEIIPEKPAVKPAAAHTTTPAKKPAEKPAKPIVKPAVKATSSKPAVKPPVKPAANKAATPKSQPAKPKVVMPNKNEY